MRAMLIALFALAALSTAAHAQTTPLEQVDKSTETIDVSKYPNKHVVLKVEAAKGIKGRIAINGKTIWEFPVEEAMRTKLKSISKEKLRMMNIFSYNEYSGDAEVMIDDYIKMGINTVSVVYEDNKISDVGAECQVEYRIRNYNFGQHYITANGGSYQTLVSGVVCASGKGKTETRKFNWSV